MVYSLMADVVVLVHLAFVVFVVAGGFAVRWWHRLAWLHLPAGVWAVGIEWSGAVCPLTPLENWLRGEAGYQGDFVARYLLPVLYPAGLTRPVQILLGLAVLAINLYAYAWLWRGRERSTL